MPDTDRLDRLLDEAGERWRARQAGPPPIDGLWQPPRRSSIWPQAILVAAGFALAGVAILAAGGAPTSSPRTAGPSPVSITTTPEASIPSSCPVTTASDPRPLASQLAGLTLTESVIPYGAPKLWALIPQSGRLPSSTSTSGGQFARTFWYSSAWSPAGDPSISVAAGRFGGGDSVTAGAAVSARSRELGNSMIAPLDLPSGGCWQITGTYRDQSLSYVVWVERDPSVRIVANSTVLPADIDGVPVARAADAAAALARTSPGRSILVGGWLMPPVVMSCPMMQTFPDPWNVCFAILLSESPWGGEILAVYRGTSDETLPTIPDGQVGPVVLRVHSRDPGCPPTADCASTAVLDDVAWLGRIGPRPALATSSPPIGLSREAAISTAIDVSKKNGARGTLEVVSAVAGPYGLVHAPDGGTAGDRWVWAVVLRGSFPMLDCRPLSACPSDRVGTSLVILDYVTGAGLIEERPAPSG